MAEGESFLFLISVMETVFSCHLNGYLFIENESYIYILKEKTIKKFAKKHEGSFLYEENNKSFLLSVKLSYNILKTAMIPVIAVFDKKREDFYVVADKVIFLKLILPITHCIKVVGTDYYNYVFRGLGPTKESWEDMMRETYPTIIKELYYPNWKPKPNTDRGLRGKEVGTLRNLITIVENYDFFISLKE